jgi:hypothetical protein
VYGQNRNLADIGLIPARMPGLAMIEKNTRKGKGNDQSQVEVSDIAMNSSECKWHKLKNWLNVWDFIHFFECLWLFFYLAG